MAEGLPLADTAIRAPCLIQACANLLAAERDVCRSILVVFTCDGCGAPDSDCP